MPTTLIPVVWDDAMIERAASGRTRIYRFDKEVPFKLSPADRRRYERAKLVGFIDRDNRRHAPENCYWEWCELHRRPVVTIRRRRKYADVSCDMIVCGWKLDAAAMNWVNERRGYPGRFDSARDPQVCFTLIERIPIDQAEAVAFRLYEVAMGCRPVTVESN